MPLRFRADQRDRRRTVTMNAVADLALRKDRFLLLELRRRIVTAFDVRATKAGELDRLSAGGEHCRFARRTLRRNLEARPQHTRIDHLRRHRPLPDQLVDSQHRRNRSRLRAGSERGGSPSDESLRALPARSSRASGNGAGRRSIPPPNISRITRADSLSAFSERVVESVRW